MKQLEQLEQLSRIPSNDGEQFIHVWLNLTWKNAGYISYGFNWKTEIGEIDFHTLNEAIKIVTDLRKQAKL